MVIMDMKNKGQNPGVAAVLSFLLSGLGQIYNGEIRKGLCILTFSFVGVVLTIIGAVFLVLYVRTDFLLASLLLTGGAIFAAGVILVSILGLYSIFDAYKK